ncbi:MAG: methyltransferase domain-containing protein [Candidatus Micrarchaeota archaeon]|nr:methyltransferase domain-containing protein [Candidatus Micrarchaeota archaeon]
MPTNKCRVCENKFLEEPLLKYENMPKTAQFLPDADSLKNDKGITLELFQCSGCGLVQLSNEPVYYYKEVIRASAVSDEMNKFRKEQFGNFVQKFSLRGKKAIEIGCGRGEYLSIMQQVGLDAYGLEYSGKSVAMCIKNGLKASKGFTESATEKINGAPFDAFFILDFLEHLPDPNSTLRGIYNNLTDDAVGFIEVPNFDALLRNNIFYDFTSDHLNYFTKETLGTTLEMNGFEVIDCTEEWHDFLISAIVKKRKRLDLSHLNKQQEKLKNELEKYIHSFKDKKVAIWGAGHQALMLIALMNSGDKIKYVVDSAAFKQGKYTPVKHLPIVSPEMLRQDPVDAVIVMVGSYTDEVVKTIHDKFSAEIDIAVLRKFKLDISHTKKRI